MALRLAAMRPRAFSALVENASLGKHKEVKTAAGAASVSGLQDSKPLIEGGPVWTLKRQKPSKRQKNMALEAAAQKDTLRVPPLYAHTLSDRDWMFCGFHLQTRNMAQHNLIYAHVFGNKPFMPVKNLVFGWGDAYLQRGNILPIEKMLTKPTVRFEGNAEDLYTVLFVNPDCVIQEMDHIQADAQALMWLVANIKGGDIATGQELAAYQHPTPYEGTGHHRIIAALLRQAQPISTAKFGELPRREFNTAEFVKETGCMPKGLVFAQTVHSPKIKLEGPQLFKILP